MLYPSRDPRLFMTVKTLLLFLLWFHGFAGSSWLAGSYWRCVVDRMLPLGVSSSA